MGMTDVRTRFRELHTTGTFLLANACDAGEARLLEALGARAVATSSAGFAATLGRLDMTVDRDEVVAHTAALVAAVDVPLSVDAEDGYGARPEDVATTVRLLADAGAAGLSVEDHDPASGQLRPSAVAVERVQAAAEEARRHGLVLTARCDGLLHGTCEVEEAIGRLRAFAEVGADCVYAPGPADPEVIARIVAAVDVPVNVLARPGGPTMSEFRDLGVRRVSVGGLFSRAATATVAGLAERLLDGGGLPADLPLPPSRLLRQAWGERDD